MQRAKGGTTTIKRRGLNEWIMGRHQDGHVAHVIHSGPKGRVTKIQEMT